MVQKVDTAWELAALRFPPPAPDGTIAVEDRAQWGLDPSHHLGDYTFGKLFLLADTTKWTHMHKDVRPNGGEALRLSFERHLNTCVRHINSSRERRGLDPLRCDEVEAVARRLRSL